MASARRGGVRAGAFCKNIGAFVLVFRLLSFEYHQSCMKGFRGMKCSVKCVECRGSVGSVCGGH